jgi:uncharacterized protein DUF6644
MPPLVPLFSAIEASTVATTIRESVILTGLLSGAHLIGLTLLLGSVLVSSASVTGILFNDQPVSEVTRAARRASIAGLTLSVATGLLLLAPRIVTASNSGVFRIKMLLLAGSALFHFAIYLPAARGRRSSVPRAVAGGAAFLLWFGVVLAGCAYILLE